MFRGSTPEEHIYRQLIPMMNKFEAALFKKENLFSSITCILILFLISLCPQLTFAQETSRVHLSTYGTGYGPSITGDSYHLLDGSELSGQSNAVAFDIIQEGSFEQLRLKCKFRALAGSEGGAFVFLNTQEFGRKGPAPFIKNWSRPNLTGTFAVGIDSFNPPDNGPFGPLGNYQGQPEREISLHWDGREIVKRIAPVEFRDELTECNIIVQHVIGGAEVTVILAGQAVFNHYFIPGMQPYESRLAIGAGTSDKAMLGFEVKDLDFTVNQPATPRRPPLEFKIFNHVRTGNFPESNEAKVTLPPINWSFGRIILTLEIHDAGLDWDPWDRNGYLYVVSPDGEKRDILPFITSFRTPGQWKVDVTHFRPWLTGTVDFEIVTTSPPDEKRGYMLSVSLDYYHGIPAYQAYRVVRLWAGTAKYRSHKNHFSDFFSPQDVYIDPSTEAARLFVYTSGHSAVGEFTPSSRTVTFTPQRDKAPSADQRFENILWKDDCYLNPIRPQNGTWKYSRAGWAPGDIIRPWEIDLTPFIVPGKTAEIRYDPKPYDFSEMPMDLRPTEEQVNQAVHLVRTYLVLYRNTGELIPAPYLKVLDVMEGSNAAQAGISVGDYLESYDGKQPQTINELRELIKKANVMGKDFIDIVVFRNDESKELKIQPGQMGVTLLEN